MIYGNARGELGTGTRSIGPIGRRTVIVLAVPGAEINRRRRLFAFLAAQARQQFPKAHIAPLPDQQTHRQDCRAPAAMQFELALRPVGQTMRQAERWRVHDRRLQREHKVNNEVLVSVGILAPNQLTIIRFIGTISQQEKTRRVGTAGPFP